MNYAEIKNNDIANGPGIRVSLFVSGCTHRCKGCFNQVAWDFNYGKPFDSSTVELIFQMLEPDYIQGITLLGGEPFEPQNQLPLIDLVERIRKVYPSKTIWAFSGYLYEDLIAGKIGQNGNSARLLRSVDVLVDGPFIEAQKNLMLRFRGSENQRLIDVPASIAENRVVLWKDWQGERNV